MMKAVLRIKNYFILFVLLRKVIAQVGMFWKSIPRSCDI